MRILIIALPRTGSTSLMLKYSNEYNLKHIFEPFGRLKKNTIIKSDNIVVKTMMHHIPTGFENAIIGYTELSKKFDKVILLSRRDLKECSESWAYFKHHLHSGFNSSTHYVWNIPPNMKKHSEDIYRWNDELEELSKILNIKILYYEDIFDKNSSERYRKNIKINDKSLL